MKENTFNFYIYIDMSTVISENMISMKTALWIQRIRFYLEWLSQNICRGLFLSNHPWLALVTCGCMSLLALLNFPFDLPQGDFIFLALSSHSRGLIFYVWTMLLFVFPCFFYRFLWSSSKTVYCPHLKILFTPHAHHLQAMFCPDSVLNQED